MLKIVLFVKSAALFFLLLSPVHAGLPSGGKSTLPSFLRTFLLGKDVKKYRLWGALIRRKVKKEWLKGLSKEEVRLLRNTIPALYGVEFRSAELQTFFGKQSWYHPKPSAKKRRLPFRARKNIEVFILEEKRLEALLRSKTRLEKKAEIVSPKKAEAVPPKKREVILEKPPIRPPLEKQIPFPAVVNEKKQPAKIARLSQTQSQKIVSTSKSGSFRWLFLLLPLFFFVVGGWLFYAFKAKKRAKGDSLAYGGLDVNPLSAPPIQGFEHAPQTDGETRASNLAASGLRTNSTNPNANHDKMGQNKEEVKKGQIKPRFKVYDSSPINAASTSKEISDTFGLNESASTTLSLFFQGDTLESIVEKRGLAESTIKTHLKSALEKGAIRLEELLDVEEQDLRCIVEAWGDLGGKRKLSAAFERLNGAYDYDLLGFVFAALSHNPNLAKQ